MLRNAGSQERNGTAKYDTPAYLASLEIHLLLHDKLLAVDVCRVTCHCTVKSPSRNIELKARLADLGKARVVAERLATAHLGVERQRDTYFSCQSGRLKLREIEGREAQLISYDRPDRAGSKASDYRLLEIRDAETTMALREMLAASLGTLVVVDKKREIFLYQNVRIHLDEVDGLGTFLEFEAVVTEAIDDAAARAQVDWLRQQFRIDAVDLLSCSYSDMLMGKRASP